MSRGESEVEGRSRDSDYTVYPAETEAASPARVSKKWVISIPFISIAIVAVFFVTMYVNDCPHQDPPKRCVWRWLGRLSFQPYSQNPLLGPSSNTLVRMGALSSQLVVKHHQGWRLLTGTWLHGGLLHLLSNLLGLVFVGVRLESDFGALRVGVLYVLAGFGGALASAMFLDNIISVGASGALFGLLGAHLSELITNWTIYENKVAGLLSIMLLVAVNLAFGLMPHVDNFAHIGGLITGFLLGFVLLVKAQYGHRRASGPPELFNCPYPDPAMQFVEPKTKHNSWQICLRWTSVLLVAAYFLTALAVLYSGVNVAGSCSFCHNFSCIPTTLWKCDRQMGGESFTCKVNYYNNGTSSFTCPNGRMVWYTTDLQGESEAKLSQVCTDSCS